MGRHPPPPDNASTDLQDQSVTELGSDHTVSMCGEPGQKVSLTTSLALTRGQQGAAVH